MPVLLHNFLMAARENGISQSRFRRDGRAIAASFIRAVETYDYDGVLVDVSTAMLAGALGVPVDFPEDLPARCKGPLIPSLEAVPDLPPPDIAGSFEIETAAGGGPPPESPFRERDRRARQRRPVPLFAGLDGPGLGPLDDGPRRRRAGANLEPSSITAPPPPANSWT